MCCLFMIAFVMCTHRFIYYTLTLFKPLGITRLKHCMHLYQCAHAYECAYGTGFSFKIDEKLCSINRYVQGNVVYCLEPFD